MIAQHERLVMTNKFDIKKFVIGSDDDDLTTEAVSGTPSIVARNESLLANIQGSEAEANYNEKGSTAYDTHSLEEFTDDTYWAAAYSLGYKTHSSLNAAGEYNEIVYLVK